MLNDTRFGGLMGSVVGEFLHPSSLLTGAPLVGVWVVLALLLHLFGLERAEGLMEPLAILLTAFFAGRFALPASQGRFRTGLLGRGGPTWGESLAYVGRFVLLLLLGSIPCGLLILIGGQIAASRTMDLGLAMLGPMGMVAGFGLASLFFLLGGVAWVLLFNLSFIVAAATRDWGELFSLHHWDQFRDHRRQDVIPYFGGIIGGVVLFYLLYSIPLVGVNLLAFQVSLEVGMAVTLLITPLPLFLLPMLVGRLAGAFVFGGEHPLREYELPAGAEGEPHSGGAGPPDPPAPSAPPPPTALLPAATPTPPPGPPPARSLARIIARARELPAADGPGALAAARATMAATRPVSGEAAFELAVLGLRFAPREEALVECARAITLCLEQGGGDMALQLYSQCLAHRQELPLEPATWGGLGELLRSRGTWLHAAWCLEKGALEGGNPTGAQKRLIEVAQGAAQGGHTREALQLYDYFLKRYPDSHFADFARNARTALTPRGGGEPG